MADQNAPFTLSLSDADKTRMAAIVRAAIERGLRGEKGQGPAEGAENALLTAPLGAFVTLKRRGQLRGCIGMVQGMKPLAGTLDDMARAAAFNDPRFPALTAAEYADTDIEISIMGPISPCPGPEHIVIGRHGLILRKGGRSGLLLPQVPVEWNWDVPTFLEQLCRKAGLPAGAWKDPDAQLLWFEAVRFDLPERE